MGYLVRLWPLQTSVRLNLLRMVSQAESEQVRAVPIVLGRFPLGTALLPLRIIVCNGGFDHLDKRILHSSGIDVLQTAEDSFCHVCSGFQLNTL